jgi:hypothetical protein
MYRLHLAVIGLALILGFAPASLGMDSSAAALAGPAEAPASAASPTASTITLSLPLIRSAYPPLYTVSGLILDGQGIPLAGVTVSDDFHRSAQTGADGTYNLKIIPGNYTLTPAYQDYIFQPPTRVVTVTADLAGMDFSGWKPGQCNELASNGSFEFTAESWTNVPGPIQPYYSTGQAHSGNQAMFAGLLPAQPRQAGEAAFYQRITIPASGNVSLSFWLYGLNGAAAQNAPEARNELYARLNSTGLPANVLLSLRSGSPGWKSYSFGPAVMNAYRGRTIDLYFGAYNNGVDATVGFYVDDVSIQVCP